MTMTTERIRLKGRLMRERVSLDPLNGWGPWCENCGLEVATDLHEPLISRAQVRSNFKLTRLITEAEENAVICCRSCNAGTDGHKRVEGSANRRRLIERQLRRYGYPRILDWLNSLPMLTSAPIIVEVTTISNELKSEVSR